MKYTVRLRVFEDDATGNWGIAPEDLCDVNDRSFNAFWSAEGLFHDIFEHWFEAKLKYFCGNLMGCIHGEMVASSIKAWLFYNTGFDGFKYTLRTKYQDLCFYEDTKDVILEMISDGYNQYPFIHKAIPTQAWSYNYIDGIVEEYWGILRHHPLFSFSASKLHKSGIYLSDIRNAYRYGYKIAELFYGKYDRMVLHDFFDRQLDLFKDLTSNHVGDYYIDKSSYGLRGFTATINTNYKNVPRVTYNVVDALGRYHSLDSLIS